MSPLYAVVLGAIVLTLMSVSLARLHKVKTKADYLVAGRSLSAFVLVFTLLSSWIGSGSLLGERRTRTSMGLSRCGRAGADGRACC